MKPNPLTPILKDLKSDSDYVHCPWVCLTFDDGPDPDYTPKILDILAEHNVHANFFVLGSAAKQYPQLIKRMIDEGHVVGNHTYSHFHPWTISSRRARVEVTRTSQVIRRIVGESPRWFRPPHGRLRKAMLDQVHNENMHTVLWNHSIIDWGPLGTEQGIAQRLHDIKFGDIVLMHDGAREHNHPELLIKQLPTFVKNLNTRGIRTVTLDQVYPAVAA